MKTPKMVVKTTKKVDEKKQSKMIAGAAKSKFATAGRSSCDVAKK